MEYQSLHYQRIHKRVCKRLLLTLQPETVDIITHDVNHETDTWKWFEAKVNADAKRLFENPDYWDNLLESFQHARTEQVAPLTESAG